jgi:hypothetical protein
MATKKTLKGSGKQRPAWMDRGVTAGPDDPIYTSGLRVSLGWPEPLTDGTARETPTKRLPDPLPDLNTNFAQLAEKIKKQVFEEAREQSGNVSGEDETENKK